MRKLLTLNAFVIFANTLVAQRLEIGLQAGANYSATNNEVWMTNMYNPWGLGVVSGPVARYELNDRLLVNVGFNIRIHGSSYREMFVLGSGHPSLAIHHKFKFVYTEAPVLLEFRSRGDHTWYVGAVFGNLRQSTKTVDMEEVKYLSVSKNKATVNVSITSQTLEHIDYQAEFFHISPMIGFRYPIIGSLWLDMGVQRSQFVFMKNDMESSSFTSFNLSLIYFFRLWERTRLIMVV